MTSARSGIGGILNLRPISLPASPEVGDIVLDQADQNYKIWSGTEWVSIDPLKMHIKAKYGVETLPSSFMVSFQDFKKITDYVATNNRSLGPFSAYVTVPAVGFPSSNLHNNGVLLPDGRVFWPICRLRLPGWQPNSGHH